MPHRLNELTNQVLDTYQYIQLNKTPYKIKIDKDYETCFICGQPVLKRYEHSICQDCKDRFPIKSKSKSDTLKIAI